MKKKEVNIKTEPTHIRIKLFEPHVGQDEIIVPKSSTLILKKVAKTNTGIEIKYNLITLLNNHYWNISEDEYNRLLEKLTGETLITNIAVKELHKK